MKKLFFYVAASVAILTLATSCGEEPRKYHIGVSQCSDDIWREQLISEMWQSTYLHDNVELSVTTANDNPALQRKQIDSLARLGIDLLIVSPIQTVTLTPVLDSLYDSGMPIVVFDRRTESKKYTAYIGASNVQLGRVMGQYVADHLGRGTTVLEIAGLDGSTPAAERSRGFAEVMEQHPGITVVHEAGDWREESGYLAMKRVLARGIRPDYVFAQNDRMALGARRAAQEVWNGTIHYCGIDALPTPGGGMQLVKDSIIEASCIYPTHGDEVVELAVRILEGQPFERDNYFPSAIVTHQNASVLLLQQARIEYSYHHLEELHEKSSEMLAHIGAQRELTWWLVAVIVLLILLIVISWYAYYNRVRMTEKLRGLNERLRQMTHEMREMTQVQSRFYTDVSHKLRTPLTLVASPIERLCQSSDIPESGRELLTVTARNVQNLVDIVNNILDFQRDSNDRTHKPTEAKIDDINVAQAPQTAPLPPEGGVSVPLMTPPSGEGGAFILIVDDNEDMRYFLRYILGTKYRVEEAENGEQALQKARELVPSLIVSDVMMPVMDGLQFCTKIKEDVATSHIPVILLTARALEEQKAEGYAHGADSYLTKPFSAKLLLSRVENLLNSRQRLTDLVAAHSKEAEIKAMLGDKDKTFYDRWKEVVVKYIPDNNASMDQLASDLGLGRVQLYRKLKALTGKAPNELLRSARLERAKVMLERTELTISQITYEVGFTSPSYFTKCFKEEYGIGPTDVRETGL